MRETAFFVSRLGPGIAEIEVQTIHAVRGEPFGQIFRVADKEAQIIGAAFRLALRLFLERYQTVLKKGGILRFKTDNVGLFDFSLEEFEAMGLKTYDLTRDLHKSPLNEGNIMTEYERAWSEKGFPIHAVTVEF